jgi:hypothetical protein
VIANPPSARPAILPTAPLLITESKEEFKRIRKALADQIKPRGILEQMYVEEIAILFVTCCACGVVERV